MPHTFKIGNCLNRNELSNQDGRPLVKQKYEIIQFLIYSKASNELEVFLCLNYKKNIIIIRMKIG